MSWGEILRKEREKLGYTLEKVEEETKIRKYYLEMMENDDFTSLPPQVYAIGFVKRYAKLLNLDENHMVSEFKLLAYGKEHHEDTVIVHTN
ncbi:MAG: helix-turn-helix domain-containing protein, partial [Syntrophomonadaceae bacterium]|nr:helix-turn-helix domain-containing protein [Syntrophomonadaceae bacterium]